MEKAKKAEQAERAIAAKELKKDIAEALEKKRVEMEVAAKAYVWGVCVCVLECVIVIVIAVDVCVCADVATIGIFGTLNCRAF